MDDNFGFDLVTCELPFKFDLFVSFNLARNEIIGIVINTHTANV